MKVTCLTYFNFLFFCFVYFHSKIFTQVDRLFIYCYEVPNAFSLHTENYLFLKPYLLYMYS